MGKKRDLGNAHRLFWYVNGTLGDEPHAFAVAAMSAENARRRVQRDVKGFKVLNVRAVEYTHAWKIDHRMPTAQ